MPKIFVGRSRVSGQSGTLARQRAEKLLRAGGNLLGRYGGDGLYGMRKVGKGYDVPKNALGLMALRARRSVTSLFDLSEKPI